jgi:hypothetical protein
MCVVNLKSVNKLDLSWKQSFLILVDSEIFRRRSLYQLELTILKRLKPSTLLHQDQHCEHINFKSTFVLNNDGEQ